MINSTYTVYILRRPDGEIERFNYKPFEIYRDHKALKHRGYYIQKMRMCDLWKEVSQGVIEASKLSIFVED